MVRAFRSKQTVWGLLGLALCPALAGCGGGETVGEALGYEQTGPDEMAVIKRPPLIVPPDYNLRPPRPGDANDGGRAASDAARETLIGPSSSAEDALDAASDARAALIGGTPNDGSTAAGTAGTASEGQNLLVSRSDRAERNLDALDETRAENRVDGALLRRLLAWTPEDRPSTAESGAEATDEIAEDEAVDADVAVQVVSRSQTVITDGPVPDQTDGE